MDLLITVKVLGLDHPHEQFSPLALRIPVVFDDQLGRWENLLTSLSCWFGPSWNRCIQTGKRLVICVTATLSYIRGASSAITPWEGLGNVLADALKIDFQYVCVCCMLSCGLSAPFQDWRQTRRRSSWELSMVLKGVVTQACNSCGASLETCFRTSSLHPLPPKPNVLL